MWRSRLPLTALLSALMTAALSACGGGSSDSAVAPPPNTGALAGTMTIGPICPVETIPPAPECLPSAAMFAAHPVYIYEQNPAAACAPIGCDKGPLVMTLTPDAQGTFSAVLPAALYVLDITHQAVGSVHGAPADIAIIAGQTTTVSINIDTGIR